jgi:transcriptional regulator GlxA family with amidase domain
MRANLAESCTVDQLAERVNMSRSRLFQLFHDEMNSTPFTVWNSLRMEAAMQQLESMELPIGEIAESIGFTQSGNFSRFFHEHQGLSPRHYRVACRAT